MTTSLIPQFIPQMMELDLIRDFEVRCAGAAITIPPASQRLVSFLAFQPKPVRRAYVSGTLWFASDEHHASASLRSALWRLHHLNLISASNTHLWLNPCVDIDLHRVTGRTMEVLRRTPPDDTVVATARDLIDVGDDILVGWYDDWVIVERERFRQLRLYAMDRIGEQLIESGRWYDALQVGLASTSAEPLRESAHRLLVRVHLMQGNVAEAIRQYALYVALLHEEMGVEPSPIMQDLVAPIVSGRARHFSVPSCGSPATELEASMSATR